MDHAEVADLITSYLDGELPAETRGQVARHLDACGECRTELAGQREIKLLLSATPLIDPPRNFVLPRTIPARRVRWLPWARAVAAAAAILLFVLIGADILTPTPRQPVLSSTKVEIPAGAAAPLPQSQAAPVVAGARAEREPGSAEPASPGSRDVTIITQRDALRLAEAVALATLIGAGGAWVIGARRARGAAGRSGR